MYCANCGAEVNPQADVCLNCGCMVNGNTKANSQDSDSIGWWFLGFFFVLIGFILWLVWKNDCPMRAKRIGCGALAGFITWVVLAIILIVVVFSLLGAAFGGISAYYNSAAYLSVMI